MDYFEWLEARSGRLDSLNYFRLSLSTFIDRAGAMVSDSDCLVLTRRRTASTFLRTGAARLSLIGISWMTRHDMGLGILFRWGRRQIKCAHYCNVQQPQPEPWTSWVTCMRKQPADQNHRRLDICTAVGAIVHQNKAFVVIQAEGAPPRLVPLPAPWLERGLVTTAMAIRANRSGRTNIAQSSIIGTSRPAALPSHTAIPIGNSARLCRMSQASHCGYRLPSRRHWLSQTMIVTRAAKFGCTASSIR
jgi:hypothetical protein